MDKGKDGCDKTDCEYHHPQMCKYEKNCKKEDCKYLHPRLFRKNEKITCKFGEKCNRSDCRFVHSEKDKGVKEKRKEEEKKEEEVKTVNNDKEKDKRKKPDEDQVFQVGRGEDPQMKEMKTMMENLMKNVNILMEERKMYWGWNQYYQQ